MRTNTIDVQELEILSASVDCILNGCAGNLSRTQSISNREAPSSSLKFRRHLLRAAIYQERTWYTFLEIAEKLTY